MTVLAEILAVAGAALVALAGVGVVRFGDLYARMHAATKASTLGFGLVAVAGALVLPSGASKLLAAVVALFLTAPSAAHLIGRVAHGADGLTLHLDGGDDLADDLAELLGEDEDGHEDGHETHRP